MNEGEKKKEYNTTLHMLSRYVLNLDGRHLMQATAIVRKYKNLIKNNNS